MVKKIVKFLVRPTAKVLTSGELVEKLDKNGDGKVSWQEIKQAPLKTKLEILGEIGIKYIPLILAL